MSVSAEIFKLLADTTRLRILRLLKAEELSVAELQEVLDMGQSRISSHLSVLRQASVVSDRKDGKRSYYALRRDLDHSVANLLDQAFALADREDQSKQDDNNLARILDQRRSESERFFNEVAGRLGKTGVPGRNWQAIGHLLFRMVPPLSVADLGAGEGLIAQLLARRAFQVYCIDKSARMVEIGRRLAAEQELDNLTYLKGDIESVPLDDHSVDLALLSQALHHAQHPVKVIGECARILKPGGRVLILDLNRHQFEQARELYGDLWLGFSPNTIYQWLKEAHFESISVDIVAKQEGPPTFETLLAEARKRN